MGEDSKGRLNAKRDADPDERFAPFPSGTAPARRVTPARSDVAYDEGSRAAFRQSSQRRRVCRCAVFRHEGLGQGIANIMTIVSRMPIRPDD